MTRHILHGLSSTLISVEIQKGFVSSCFVEIAALDDWPAGCCRCHLEILTMVSYFPNLCICISISVLWNDSSDGRHTAPANAASIRVLEHPICVRIRTRCVVIQGSRSMHTHTWYRLQSYAARKSISHHLHAPSAYFYFTGARRSMPTLCAHTGIGFTPLRAAVAQKLNQPHSTYGKRSARARLETIPVNVVQMQQQKTSG